MDKQKYYITTAIAIHPVNRISETPMRSYWQTRSHVTRDRKDTMYFSRQELTSMVRRSSSKQKKQESHQRNS